MEYQVKKDIESRLLQLKSARRVSKDQIVMRCKFCGDSKKDPNKARLYIKINPYTDEPILYHCFNCQESGIVTPSVLRILGINDLTISSDLVKYNKTSNTTHMKHSNKRALKFKVPKPKDTELNRIKKSYIEDRLGLSFTYDDLVDLKVVFSLEQFLIENNIDSVTVNPKRANLLNDEYVGFLSGKNEMISFRDITNKNKLRYDKYMILPNYEDCKKFYTIPASVDLLTEENIHINIAEGSFDILGVYFHVKNMNRENNIYIAVNDSGYMSVLKHFLSLGLVGKNIIINIFSDKDKEPWFYKKIISELKPFVGKINLYYNELSKDFGVPKNQIKTIKMG